MDEKVLDAARAEIKIHGLKFTMDDITRRLHISKTSLYAAVGSKDKLIAALVHAIMDGYNHREQAILMGNFSTVEKMKKLIVGYTETFKQYDNHLFIDVQAMYPEIWQEWLTYQNNKVHTYVNIIKHGIADGEIVDCNTAVLHKCLLASITAVNDYEFLQQQQLTYAEAVADYLDIIFQGLETKK